MPHSEIFQGLACHRLSLPCGDTVWVAEQGAQVLSWVSQGDERLFLSPANVWDGQSAIRGGVPLCFPQFNQRGDLPKHGFARNMSWFMAGMHVIQDQAHIDFTLTANAHTRAIWPQEFVAQLHVQLQPGRLQMSVSVHNTDTKPLLFTGALHTYLAVDDIDLTDVTGLQGQAEWDALADVHGVAAEALYFDGEFDRVYAAAPGPLRVQDGRGVVCVEQSPSWGQSVVWNPGPEKCATLADMPSDGFARMVCVEAAQVFEPILVPAGQQWLGWQRLTVS
jgi:glucose-6-phosphate 1-epimerase